jgi:RHH-type transcriptional regulator, proline utilization regulon repressor / proline dehydrogenase / delta 1-pyrroline-5-carboxylate dehydrogenase
MEPTGLPWLPIAVFFITRGHVVYRVSSAESADLRRYLSKHAKVLRWVEEAPQQGRILVQHGDVPEVGYYVAPTVIEVDDPDAPIAREEIFGPVLIVLQADDLGAAIEIANRSEYALTVGINSRSPANIARAAAELRAGNVYINRHITGAIVGRRPIGGYGLSGWAPRPAVPTTCTSSSIRG